MISQNVCPDIFWPHAAPHCFLGRMGLDFPIKSKGGLGGPPYDLIAGGLRSALLARFEGSANRLPIGHPLLPSGPQDPR